MANPVPKVEKHSITVTFGDEDLTLYESIQTAAKNERRTTSQFLLLYLVNHFEDAPATN